MVAIRTAPTTPGTVLISEIFLWISEMPIGMLFRETAKHTLAVNPAVQRLVTDAVTTVHTGDVDVAEDDISQKLILISLNPAMEDVVVEDALHIMALALEEERIDS